MPDFFQGGPITTLHDLRSLELDALESLLLDSTEENKIGLVLPVTAADMQAPPFPKIINQLKEAHYIDTVAVVLGNAPDVEHYRQAKEIVSVLGDKADVLWTDGARFTQLYQQLTDAGFHLNVPGKGRSVWTAFGYLLASPRLKAFLLHDCDIVNYDRQILARLTLPMAHPSLDFEFCKAYYARVTDRMHGRVVRLLVTPLLRALISVIGDDPFLVYLNSFRYPLAGEFAVSSTLARSNRMPSDWGLEVGTLAEVFRNTSVKRVCQVDLCVLYEHKHQDVSLDNPKAGLMKMASDILTTVFRTLASRGTVLSSSHFNTLRCAYLRDAQDCIRQYHCDALINGLSYDRHDEEHITEGFARQIMVAGDIFENDPTGGEAIPNWARVLAAFRNFPQKLRMAAAKDAEEFC